MMNVDSAGPSSAPTSMDVDSSLPSIADDSYTDNDHRQNDEVVNQKLAGIGLKWHQSPPIQILALVLRAVVLSDDRLDRKYRDFDPSLELIRDSPLLQSMLTDAWKAGSYRDIRELAILQPEDTSMPAAGAMSEAHLQVLRNAFTATYQGRAVDAFHKYLQQNNKAFHKGEDRYYGKFCSIVQSSGTGKTRLLLQLAARGVCVLYMNIRSPNDKQGYPPRDNIPADILTHTDILSEAGYHNQCFAFFATIFKVLGTFLQKKLNWQQDMCTIGSPARTSFFVALDKEFANVKKEVDSTGSAIVDKYYQDMVARLPQAKDNEPRLVIALDEAHVLHEKHSRPYLRASVLLRIINSYSERDKALAAVWVVFASTTAKVVHFASPQALSDSARVYDEGQLLFRPFTQLGWNQNAPAFKDVPPDQVGKAEHILRYGRPLWVSVITGPGGYTLNQLLKLTSDKLCGTGNHDLTVKQQAFAVLAQRFGLDVAFGHRNAVHLLETSVASHLRVCIKTTEDRIWIYSTYPSEPILSCAAASVLHAGDNLLSALRRLEQMVNAGLIEIGQSGELASRLLWLLAKDFFVREKLHAPQAGDFNEVLPDCQMIPVVDFLDFVFGSEVWGAVPRARNEFRNAYVNFSHWVSMDFDIRRSKQGLKQLPIDSWTLRHWQCTSAVQCCHNQPLIDKVIPMYFKPQTPGGQAGMSQIFISDKAGSASQHDSLLTISRDHSSIAPDYRGLPYIAILVDLGVEKTDLWVSANSSGNEDMCMRIHAYGFNETTYPFLRGRPELTRILRDLYKRQFPASERTFEEIEELEDQVQFGRSSELRYMDVKE